MTAISARRILVSLALACAAWLSACKSEVTDATEVIVVIDSDKDLKSQLATIEVDILDKDAQDVASHYEFKLGGKISLPISFGVYQPEGGAGVFRLHTRGLNDEGELLVEDKVIDRFEKGKRRDLKVTLSSACKGNFCPESLTCNPRTGACEEVPRPDGVDIPTQSDEAAVTVPEAGGPSSTLDAGPDASDAEAQPVSEAGPEAGPEEAGVQEPVPPSLAGAATFGGRRTDGTITVYDDGFEQGQRICTADGKFCVTGGFSP